MRNLSILSLLLLSTLLFSCENNGMLVWDVYPVVVRIYVQDSEGNNLLLEDTPNNILSNDIKITYNDEVYTIANDTTITGRAYNATFTGLELFVPYEETEDYQTHLTFGEFDGTDDWDEFIYLELGDGKIHNINFKNEYKGLIDDKVIINREYYLDAKKIDSSNIYFTL